ncbi:hypothetical protein B0H15DRAFT_818411 [Mycena belliarum]|uniref:F-box domain-containing protein n=1 Tax=Mycena belliarum TaxID=1033014 RepID=A0AAD6UI89_9AGAR|nr:hypothetical protein B0H15DRAFT_818411 [Mycena belliae]
MTELNDFSNEILLQIFPKLPLKSLIAAHGVNKLWRHLASIADISPARRGLLDLYFKIIESPIFEQTRSWLLDNLTPFDREAYIDALLAQHDYLPDDFRIWILEWPAKAVIGCHWPGLPAKYFSNHRIAGLEAFEGCNFLGCIPPVVHTVVFEQIGRSEEVVAVKVPALLAWEDGQGKTWIVLRGKPVCSHAIYHLSNATYDGFAEYGDPDQFPDLDEDEEEDWVPPEPEGDYAFEGVCSSWTYWMKSKFDYSVDVARSREDCIIRREQCEGWTMTPEETFWHNRDPDEKWEKSNEASSELV